MRRRILDQRLADMDRRGVWAFTPATLSVVFGNPSEDYLRLVMKRLADQGVLVRAARGVYVNPHARSMPDDVRAGLIRFLRPRELTYISLESKLSEVGAISQVSTVLTCMTRRARGHARQNSRYLRDRSHFRQFRLQTDIGKLARAQETNESRSDIVRH